jgi:hypothetical protein
MVPSGEPTQQTLDALAPLGTEAADIGVATFSALTGQGVADVAEALRGWIAPPAPAVAPPAATPAEPGP